MVKAHVAAFNLEESLLADAQQQIDEATTTCDGQEHELNHLREELAVFEAELADRVQKEHECNESIARASFLAVSPLDSVTPEQLTATELARQQPSTSASDEQLAVAGNDE